jgi:YD repeat-containing protein
MNGFVAVDPTYWVISYPLNMFWYKPTEKKTTEYAGTDSMSTDERYRYNTLGQLVRSDVTNSKGSTESTLYTYPNDTTGTNASLCKNNGLYENLLFQRNLVNGVEMSKTAIDYMPYYPSQAATFFETIVRKDVMQSYNGQSPFEAISFDSYGGMFAQLQQYTEKGITTSILWGYDGSGLNPQYPVAKIVGSDYATVGSSINQSTLNIPTSDEQLRDYLNTNVRQKLPNAQVTTYTYAPLIGITSETDPKGYTLYYDYDSFGRLIDAKDKDGKIIKTYQYHYQGQ